MTTIGDRAFINEARLNRTNTGGKDHGGIGVFARGVVAQCRKIVLQQAGLAGAVGLAYPQGSVGVGEHHCCGKGASGGAALRQLT